MSSTHTAAAAAPASSVSITVLFFAIIALVVVALALAVKTWGLVALGLTALACVPVMFAVLLLITVGK